MSSSISSRRRGWRCLALGSVGLGLAGGMHVPPPAVSARVARAPLAPPRGAARARGALWPPPPQMERRPPLRPRRPASARGSVRALAALGGAGVPRAVLPAIWVMLGCILGMLPSSAAFIPGRRSADKLLKRTFTGCALGLLVSCWIFSSPALHVGVFCAMGVLAQQEYYEMAQGRGLFPARKLSMVGSLVMYLAAADGRRGVVDAALPLAGIYTTMYLLLRPKPEPTLDDVTSTFLGIYYLGFLPSFWVRLRGVCALGAPCALGAAPRWLGLRGLTFTHGTVISWWTFLSIVCSDIGAYFVGKGFGCTKLISSVSPNKTLEGALGGMLAAVASSLLGAYLMRWPLWYVSGALHGVIASACALIGDLTISMFKRSSGVKVGHTHSRARRRPSRSGPRSRLRAAACARARARALLTRVPRPFAAPPRRCRTRAGCCRGTAGCSTAWTASCSRRRPSTFTSSMRCPSSPRRRDGLALRVRTAESNQGRGVALVPRVDI